MNILVTLDRNYLPPLRVMLGSLLRNDPGETFEIYAIGDGLMPEDWAALEELCAGRGRIHPFSVYQQLIGIQVDDQFVKGQLLFSVFLAAAIAAQHCVDAGQYLFHHKRFCDVIICP